MKKINNFSEELIKKEQQIILSIKDDSVPTVSQDEIKTVCKVAVSYYTKKQSIWNIDFWKVIFSSLTIKSAFLWILFAFLLGTCVVLSFFVTRYEFEPLALMTTLSPVPILAFAIRELHYRDNNLVQLEKTCKYTPDKIYFTRLWIGMIFNALFVASLGVIAFADYENILQVYFCSFIAMFFVGAVALFLLSFLDNALPLSLIMAIWVLGSVYLLCKCEVLDVIMNTSLTVFMGMLVFSFILFVIATINTTVKLYA